MTLAYLATPYSKRKSLNRAFIEACELAGRLIISGVDVFSPIAHFHFIAMYGGIDPLDHRLWTTACAPFLDRCKTLIVAHLDGWNESEGIAHEIDVFQKAGKTIFDCDPTTLQMVRRT